MTTDLKCILLMFLGIMPPLVTLPSPLATTLMSPQLLVMPTGIALATMANIRTLSARGIDKLLALMIAYLVSLFIFMVTFMLLERLWGIAAFLVVAFGVMTLLSVADRFKTADERSATRYAAARGSGCQAIRLWPCHLLGTSNYGCLCRDRPEKLLLLHKYRYACPAV